MSPSTPAAAPSVDAFVQALVAARRDGVWVDAERFDGVLSGVDAACAVQDAVAQALGWFGPEGPRHWKSGGPSRDAAMGHAPLPPAGVLSSPAVMPWPMRQRGVEAEIALRIGEAVDPQRAAGLDLAGACALVDAMAPAIELVDTRFVQGFKAPALLRMADAQSHAALVLGAWVPYSADRDWSQQALSVQLGEHPASTHRGSHACLDPAWTLPAWFRHATRHGQTIPAGTVVSTGTWCGVQMAEAGQRVHVAFEGVGEVEVRL